MTSICCSVVSALDTVERDLRQLASDIADPDLQQTAHGLAAQAIDLRYAVRRLERDAGPRAPCGFKPAAAFKADWEPS